MAGVQASAKPCYSLFSSKKLAFSRWLALIALCLPLLAMAKPFQTALDESSWSTEGSVFQCRMLHRVPYYGEAVFEQRAGESPRFRLKSNSPRLSTGEASLVSRPPVWKPGGVVRDLGYVPVEQGDEPVSLDERGAQRLLAELFAGQDVAFTRMPWYDEQSAVRVMLSPVNFRLAYQQYLGCQAQLLPVNFDQIRRTAVFFPVGSDELPVSELKKLDQIALYVKADERVQSFFVDGHTDSQGSRSDNLALSQRRAQQVTELLIERGIPADRITSRWHGERYPVATNRTVQGRADNRRVTIRLQKVSPELQNIKAAN